eukprot:Nitzschia sp. Nitz4//scaffold40_size135432//72250//73203//NITZ4_003248-RA/size135432-processed-gene-0.42-mRNA-1//1//CDS//3329551231//7384//frame0
MLHRYRQRFFYLRCMRHLQLEAANQTAVHAPVHQPNWVALIDVDEFLFPNRDWVYTSKLPARKENITTTVADIANLLVSNSHFSGPCIALPRLLIGTKRDDEFGMASQPLDRQVQQTLSSITDSDEHVELLTLTWNWREDLDSVKSNKGGKALVQLSDVPSASLGFHEVDVHRPVKGLCSTEKMWIKIRNSPLVLHHYIGSREQYTFRSDPRQGKRSIEEYQRYENINASSVDFWDTRIWVLSFVEAVGQPRARKLLRGAGQLEKVGSPPLDDEASYENLLKAVYPNGLPTITNSSISNIQLTPLLKNLSKRTKGLP